MAAEATALTQPNGSRRRSTPASTDTTVEKLMSAAVRATGSTSSARLSARYDSTEATTLKNTMASANGACVIGSTTALRSCRCSSTERTPNAAAPMPQVMYVRSKAVKLPEHARQATM